MIIMKVGFATVLLAAVSLSSAADAAPARTFLRQAIQGDNSEVAMGRLAQQRGASAGVRDFGRTLQRDHSNSRAKASRIARTMRVTPPTSLKPDAPAHRAHLLRYSGRAFDREFARMMVTEHQNDIAMFERQARTGDRATAQFARQTLPVLRSHLRIAQRLAR